MVIEDDKKITVGVENKANPALNLHDQMWYLFTMRQGQTENDN